MHMVMNLCTPSSLLRHWARLPAPRRSVADPGATVRVTHQARALIELPLSLAPGCPFPMAGPRHQASSSRQGGKPFVWVAPSIAAGIRSAAELCLTAADRAGGRLDSPEFAVAHV